VSRWRPGPGRLSLLLVGLWLFGTGDGLITGAKLGNSPWTVLAQGVSKHSPLSIGEATIVLSFLVLLVWIPLRQRPGLGTILNAIIVGVAIDVTLSLLADDQALALRIVELLGGTLLVGLGSGIYLTCALGPGPRDGLMVGIHRRFGPSVGQVRTALELSVFAVGAFLGGRAGVGTLVFAVTIGPLVAIALRLRGAEAREI
jgi:uncharacterized membrane protein YczE